jgi:TonB family protein
VKEAASQVMSVRALDRDGLRKTLILSLVGHVACVAAIFAAPDRWVGSTADEPTSMTIRLGGADAPGEGGLTSLGALPIQQVIPLTELRRPQWIQPPADTLPQNVVPVPEAPRAEPKSEVVTAPEESRGRQLTSGHQLQDGNAMSETGAEGIGVGLSAGGLGGDGSELSLSDFCCPEYLSTMISLIRQRWNSNQETSGAAVVRFTVHRDGRIDTVDVTRSSGFITLDQSARRAILLTRELPPLPRSFMETSLTVRLTFEYRR